MKTIKTHTMELKGSSYEIGRTLGRIISSVPPLKQYYTAGFHGFGPEEVREAQLLFHRWCPGLNEELAGFADEVQTAPEDVLYYATTYLRPNCSHVALLPSKTANGHPLLARNYEFNDEMEDFNLIKTNVNGKYTHIGTSVLSFGRDDGFNEHGLAVTMSSCGFPVGADKQMRRPAIKGLQFWAVIRSLLENCRDTEESLLFLKEMPVSYNLNLILLDKTGHAALVETLDGKLEVRRIDETSGEVSIHATNHPIIGSMIALEPNAMAHSLKRYQYISDAIDQAGMVTAEYLKTMLLSPYPDGLCCHYYKEFFGTTKSMIIDPLDGTIELCWGGSADNGWRTYQIENPMGFEEFDISIENELADPALFKFLPIRK